MTLGTTYAGTADLDAVTAAVEAACGELDLARLENSRLPGGGVRIEARSTAPWYRICAGALAQRVSWELRPVGEGPERLTVDCDLRLFRWYAVLLVTVCTLAFAGLLATWIVFEATPPTERPAIAFRMAGLFIVSLLLLPVGHHLLGALGGGGQTAALWGAVQARLGSKGRLEPVGSTVSRRYGRASFLYLVAVLAAVAWPVGNGLVEIVELSSVAELGLLVAQVGLLFFFTCAIVLMYRSAAFMLRTEPLLVGLVSSATLLMFLALPLPWVMTDVDVGELLGLYEQALAPEEVAAASDLPQLRSWGRTLVGFTGVVGVFVVLLALIGARLLPAGWRACLQLQERRASGVYREAARGGPSLRWLRRVFVGFWALSAVVLLAGLGFTVLDAVQAVFPALPFPRLRLAELTGGALSLALGGAVGDPLAGAVARLGWTLHGLSAFAFLLISVGHLHLEHRRARRRLHRLLRDPEHPRQPELQRTLDELVAGTGLGSVKLVVDSGMTLQAAARTFGVRPERYVEVAADCLRHLGPEDLRALLAHELGHHLAGHARHHQLLRWLGRVTFVGDGFALALQDSWHSELTADRAVWERLGVPRESLRSALETLTALRTAWRLKSGAPRAPRALPVYPHELANRAESGWTGLGFAEQVRIRWRLFADQYFRGMDLHYWHPGERERLAVIQGADRDG